MKTAKPSISFTTNICAHYRVNTFEILASYYDVHFYFFSTGDEWYWQKQHGVQSGDFHSMYLPGFGFWGIRLTPTLPINLWKKEYEVYIKCINGRFALPMTYLIARLRKKPFILWTGIWMRLQTPFHRLAFPLTRFIYHHSDAIVVYGEHVKRYLVSEGVPAERIFVAAHAVDNDAHAIKVREDEVAALRQKHKIGPRQKVVLYLGRLEEVKGLSYLLNAFASLQRDEEVLVLAGTGSERPFLERSAEDLGIADRVRFTGYISPENAVPYYALAYVFVLPSITLPAGKELWGLVINEAFNQGVPVIATDAVGAAAGGLVQDGVNGFVVAERNVEPLRQALQLILEDTELRERLSTNAKQTISKWDNENMVLGFRQAIAYVLRGR